MSEKRIKTYKGKFYSGEEFKKQGVVDGDASILEIFERAVGNYLIKIDAQDLEDFLNGKLPFQNINKIGFDEWKKEFFSKWIKDSLEYFIGQEGHRDIGEFVYLKQFELDNTRNKDYFRWDDMYFTSVYATDKEGHVRMISYYVPEDYHLYEIPENLLYLKHLEILDLPYNYIEKIPDDIEKLENLRYLSLYGNEIPQNIAEWYGTLHKLTLLEYLELSSMKIRNVPAQFGYLKNLRYLDLSDNNIKRLPDEIGNLRNIEYLDLSNNKINSLPESIGNLKNLRYLNISRNNINSLPDSIGNLTNLREFRFHQNNIKNLPKTIENLENLLKNLSNNDIIIFKK